MSEHVGESQIDRYARSLYDLLRPGGVLLNHAIAALDPEYDSLEDEFSMRYVFPDGEALRLSRVQLALERAGLQIDQVEGFREDYARTLRDWTDTSGRAHRASRATGWGRSARASGGCIYAPRDMALTPTSPPSIRTARAVPPDRPARGRHPHPESASGLIGGLPRMRGRQTGPCGPSTVGACANGGAAHVRLRGSAACGTPGLAACGQAHPISFDNSWGLAGYVEPGSRYLRVSGQRSSRPNSTSVSA